MRLGGLPLNRTLGRANAPAQKDAGPEEARSTGCDLMLRSVAVRAYLCTTPAKYVGGVLKFIFDRAVETLGPQYDAGSDESQQQGILDGGDATFIIQEALCERRDSVHAPTLHKRLCSPNHDILRGAITHSGYGRGVKE